MSELAVEGKKASRQCWRRKGGIDSRRKGGGVEGGIDVSC